MQRVKLSVTARHRQGVRAYLNGLDHFRGLEHLETLQRALLEELFDLFETPPRAEAADLLEALARVERHLPIELAQLFGLLRQRVPARTTCTHAQ